MPLKRLQFSFTEERTEILPDNVQGTSNRITYGYDTASHNTVQVPITR